MSSNSSFVPPFFPKFGKNVRDLLKKKFDFDHTVKSVSKTSRGLQFENGAHLTENGALRGFVKGKFAVEKAGEGEVEITTDAAYESKANFKLTQLAKGLTANFLTQSKDKQFKKPIGGLELEYSQANFAATAAVKSDLEVHKVDASIALGSDGISVGGAVQFDCSRGAQLVDSNFGAEYSTSDFSASLFTEKNAQFLNTGFHQRVSGDHVLGAMFRYELSGKQERSLAIGDEYRVDRDTTIKAKVELPSGDLFTAVEHRLANPRMLIAVAAQYNAKSQSFAADKLGVQLTLGDF